MNTLESDISFLDGYRRATSEYDELTSDERTIRPHWRGFVRAFHQYRAEDLAHRAGLIDRLIQDNGVTFNAFAGEKQPQRPWRLDQIPLVLAQDEWRRLEEGLAQRAWLLENLLHDIYGPQHLLREGLLPPETVLAHPGFFRPFHGLHPYEMPSLVLYGVELARAPDGGWFIMADRTNAPEGPGFTIENRIVLSRTNPHLMQQVHIQRLAPFFGRLQNTLRKLAIRPAEDPQIVLLTPGPTSRHYFEDVYLARYLGTTVVESGDLAVRDERVFLKTLAGLVPVDVIFSRTPENLLDALELDGRGVPGLLQSIRSRQVVVANTPGSGLVESPVFMAFLPELARRLLNQDLLLPSIPTWWCGKEDHRKYVFDHLTDLVIKPSFQASGGEEIFGDRLYGDEVARLRARIEARPYAFIAQEKIRRSRAPVWDEGKVRAGHLAVRAFLAKDEGRYILLPGGLVRFAPTADPMELSIAAGEGSKDLWVPADEVEAGAPLEVGDHPVKLRRTSALFPSRVADDLYWLGHYMDRVDYLSRVLRAALERLAAESETSSPELPVFVRVLADQGLIEPGFVVSGLDSQLPDLADALPQAVRDTTEVRGLAYATSEMLRLATQVRDRLSPDVWTKLHQTGTAFLSGLRGPANDVADTLDEVNFMIMELAAASGLIHDGTIRGPAWRFFDMGRRVERARNVIHLVLCILHPEQVREKAVFKAIIELLDCRMTYRLRYMDNVQQNGVLDLAITDETNPRSIVFQIEALAEHVEALPKDGTTPLSTEEKRIVLGMVHGVHSIDGDVLASDEVTTLQEALTQLDAQLANLVDALTRKYLVHSGTPRQISPFPGIRP
jgi:uncharacterized circularly permuted ATP-grasp superfamily protein/uncharacterized alpha-E superfamily protein